MIKHQGGCHCGKVRFTTEYDPLLVGQCNCTRCRRLYGTMSVGAMFGENELEVSGETYEYTFNGGSGMPVHLHSCSTCGTRIYAEPEAFGGMMYVLLGSFDNSLEFVRYRLMFCSLVLLITDIFICTCFVASDEKAGDDGSSRRSRFLGTACLGQAPVEYSLWG